MSWRRADLERGIAVVLVVVLINAVLVGTAFAVDLGRLWVVDRSLQRASDVAALDAARFLSRPYATPEELHHRVVDAAVQSAARNGYEIDPSQVELGHFVDDEWIPVAIGGPDWPPTAVSVEVGSTTHWLFRPGSAARERAAVAATGSTATIAVGSDLVDLASTRSDLLNAVFGGLIGPGAGAELTAVGWSALALTSVSLERLVAQADVLGMPDYLRSELPYAEHLRVLAATLDAMGAAGPAADVWHLVEVAATLGTVPPVRLLDLLDLRSSEAAALAAQVGVLDLVHGLALLGRAGGPAIDLDTSVNLASLVGLHVRATVIEPPQIASGPVGTRARTAQVTTSIELRLDLLDQTLVALGPLFTGLLGGLLQAALNPILGDLTSVRLAVEVEGASATTTITDIACASPGYVDTSTTTQVAGASVVLAGISLPLTLGGGAGELRHVEPYGWASRGRVTGTLELEGALSTVVRQVVLNRLLGVLGGLLAPLLNPVVDVVEGVLTAGILGALDDVLQPTLDLLGIGVGNASVAVLGAECGEVRLVR